MGPIVFCPRCGCSPCACTGSTQCATPVSCGPQQGACVEYMLPTGATLPVGCVDTGRRNADARVIVSCASGATLPAGTQVVPCGFGFATGSCCLNVKDEGVSVMEGAAFLNIVGCGAEAVPNGTGVDLLVTCGVEAKQAGTPVAGGPFTTVNFVNGTATDAGGGQLDYTAPAGGGGSDFALAIYGNIVGVAPIVDVLNNDQVDDATVPDSFAVGFIVPAGKTLTLAPGLYQVLANSGATLLSVVVRPPGGGVPVAVVSVGLAGPGFYTIPGLGPVPAGHTVQFQISFGGPGTLTGSGTVPATLS